MLSALTFSTRAHEIFSLNIGLLKLPTHYIFHLSKITKTAKEGKLRPSVQLTQLYKSLCACHYIDVYLERAKAWWKNEGQLLFSLINPHRFVTNQFLDRLLRFYHYLELALQFLRPIQQDQPPHERLGC